MFISSAVVYLTTMLAVLLYYCDKYVDTTMIIIIAKSF